MPLTNMQIAEYQERGYLVVEDVIPPRQLNDMCSRIDAITSAPEGEDAKSMGLELEPGAKGMVRVPRKLNRLASLDPVFGRHAEMSELLGMVGQLIGKPVRLYADQAFLKPPCEGSAKPPHQDNAHFGIDPPECGVTTWTALDDATVENGCMQYIPGSHRLGNLIHGWIEGTTHLVPQDAQLGVPEHVPVRRGGVIFHQLLTFHMSAPNKSDIWRRAYACHYIRTHVGGVRTTHFDEEPVRSKLGGGHPLNR